MGFVLALSCYDGVDVADREYRIHHRNIFNREFLVPPFLDEPYRPYQQEQVAEQPDVNRQIVIQHSIDYPANDT